MELERINAKITEAKTVIEKLRKTTFNEHVTEFCLASGLLECKYRDAVNSGIITYAMAADLIETEKRIERLISLLEADDLTK